MGHAMRCLALVQALVDQHGGSATFVMADPPDAFVARAGYEGAAVVALDADPGSLEDAEETAALARARKARWIVVDGYHFDSRYQRAVRDAGLRLLALDDRARLNRYHADLVLNQNAGASPELYRDRVAGTRLLLGPAHALLRREFRRWEGSSREVPAMARRVLVTLGGADPEDVTSRVVGALAKRDERYELQVVAGAVNPHRKALERAAASDGFELTVEARDMPHRMAWADLAVAAAGSTSWELARVGTPQLAIVLAENQELVARSLEAAGLAVSLGWHADLRPEQIAAAVDGLAKDRRRRAELSRRGREVVDGQGALRVLAAMGA
jgi:UDP-2,4-diacetamido-2,4,6-trideoxy-beta-L-altropyranose hydrolase